MLTIAYMTNRKNPRIEWFFDSLHAQCHGNYEGIKIVVVDFYAEEEGRKEYISCKAHCPVVHVPPKPTVWQGKYRLTSENYFAASNARNTALCLAEDGQIAYVDDLSVLLPGWLPAVQHAESSKSIVFGTYEKVMDLQIQNGVIIHFKEKLSINHEGKEVKNGKDVRYQHLMSRGMIGAHPCGGEWLFGCSLTLPVEALLSINGWDEDCDSMGYEDVCAGHMITQQGWSCFIDTNMKTLEDDKAHFEDQPFRRQDKPNVMGHKDASNAYIYMLYKGGRNRSPNYFGPEGIAGLRKKILAGEPFPVSQIPEHDWRDGQPIREM